jgi:hypothetical protein
MHSRFIPRQYSRYVAICTLATVAFSTMLTAGERDAVRTLQDLVDELTLRLAMPVEVTAAVVPANPLLVSVEPVSGRQRFVMSFQASFVDGLDTDELRAIVAHELGHVWIFTHHPYLQTERGANDVAMRLVSRGSLERVYDRVWADSGVKGNLAKFLPPQ